MADKMIFPDTVEEFMERYKMVDREQVYSNGTEYVPIFRMKQWFDHAEMTVARDIDVPIKRGRWLFENIGKPNEHCVCSECGTRVDSDEAWHYCPNCGAKMEGEE